jgi:release factor glutamine methyltransferase
MTSTWRELRAHAAERLADAGIIAAEAEARFMVEQASGYDAGEWLEAAEVRPPARAVTRLHDMAARRLAGEPLQYVLGAWSFRGLDLMLDRRVLIPRPET